MKLLFILGCFLTVGFSFAEDPLSIIAVGEAETVKDRLVIKSGVKGTSVVNKKIVEQIKTQIFNNFSFYKKNFNVIASKKPSNEKSVLKEDYNFFANKDKTKFVVNILGKEKSLDVAVHDTFKQKRIFFKKVDLPVAGKVERKIVHELSSEMFFSITGKKSIFKTKIVFVSDVSSRGKLTIKELYIADFDGKNTRRLTYHKGIVISPSLNRAGDKVLYSLIRYSRGKRNVNLRLLDLKTMKSKIISSKRGINSGAIFANDEDYIYLTLSHKGNADIYKMHLPTKKLTQITTHSSDDVDPSINRNGDLLSFLSGRPGKASIYTADANKREKNVRRISYVGQFNATPRFNPEGSEIAFSSWVDNRFDIYRINSAGTELVRLTKNFGSNESPSYSNDGQFIVFSSQRVISQKKAVQNLYIMDREGEILGNITASFGNCLTPRWSK